MCNPFFRQNSVNLLLPQKLCYVVQISGTPIPAVHGLGHQGADVVTIPWNKDKVARKYCDEAHIEFVRGGLSASEHWDNSTKVVHDCFAQLTGS